MTAAEVPQGGSLILRDTYDSREGNCGNIRIRSEAFRRLRSMGLLPQESMYFTSLRTDGALGVVEVTVLKTRRSFLCLAVRQPKAECELLIYEQPYKHRPDA